MLISPFLNYVIASLATLKQYILVLYEQNDETNLEKKKKKKKRRATSSHLQAVPAGNSQRNNLAVSECQEELNNATVPLFTTRRRAENRVSEPHEAPNITAPVHRGSRPPSHVRPYDR